MEMTPRKEKILSSVVTGYVKSGEPVGSKAIADEIGVSSATVRDVYKRQEQKYVG